MRVKPDKIKRKRRAIITVFEINWDSKYSELRLYKKHYGHCNVPQRWSENPSLGSWVIRQRTYSDYLSPDRVTKLNKLGFIWDLPNEWWNKSYNQLVKFKNQFGHCNVSKGDDKHHRLAEWVGKQRRDFKQKHSCLNYEKIEKLNLLDFNWGATNTSWEQRYNELYNFKIRFGHCRVLQRWKENLQLANWVVNQRELNKNQKLSVERFTKLEELDFQWSIKPRKKIC